MRLTGAEIIVRALADLGVEVVFGYPGGAVLPIYDAIFRQNRVRHILVRHEQAAVHMAEGYARSTGRIGVVLVTSGPGATNTVTGLTDALMDSVPVLCLTGQVPTHLIGNDAFQEADTVGITRSCTKHNYLIKDIRQLVPVLTEAYTVAAKGRPGPVVVDLPKDVQNAELTYVAPACNAVERYRPKEKPAAPPGTGGARSPPPGQTADHLRRGRRGELRAGRMPLAHAARSRNRVPGHHDADGPRRRAGQRAELPRHARDARDVRSQHGDARLRRDAERGRALR